MVAAFAMGTRVGETGLWPTSFKTKPRDFREYDEMKSMPTIRMEQAIHEGLKGTAMPSFSKFSESQTEALTNYLRSLLADSYMDFKNVRLSDLSC